MSLDSPLTRTDILHTLATKKVMLRLLPLMCAAYFMAYIDRTNVALAKTELQADVGISAAVFGLGAGIFFLSYAFLEVPSNLAMHRIGPRRWIARIALTWGALSALMVFVQGDISFYVMRFLLGAAEAGLYPALMYMVTVWFSQKHRVTAVGLIYLAPSVALIIGGPLGGGLMELDGVLGMNGWQWMFLVEGIVTMLVGLIVWRSLPEKPSEATWLTDEEASLLTERAVGDNSPSELSLKGNWKMAFGRPFILVVALIYFFNQVTSVAVVFNFPAIVESLDIEGAFLIGAVSGTAGIGATLGVLVIPLLQRRYDNEVALIGLSAAATAVLAIAFLMSSGAVTRIALLAALMFFVIGTLPLFWSVAMERMSGLMAAAGLAFINTIGLIGGFVGPYLFGLVESATGDPSNGLYIVVVASAIGLALVPLLRIALRVEDASASRDVHSDGSVREPIPAAR